MSLLLELLWAVLFAVVITFLFIYFHPLRRNYPHTDDRAQVVDTPDDDPRNPRDADRELPEAYPGEDEPPSLEF